MINLKKIYHEMNVNIWFTAKNYNMIMPLCPEKEAMSVLDQLFAEYLIDKGLLI